MKKRFRHLIVPIMEWLDDAIETTVYFKFGVPSDFGEFYRAFVPIRNESKGTMRVSFKTLYAHGGERYDKYGKALPETNFPIKHIPDSINLTDVFKEIDFSKRPFFHCELTRHAMHVNDTLWSRIYVPSFTIIYRPIQSSEGKVNATK